eukprot:TRINITY_DN13332_c0_g1_i4.p1 TRINITY_DN13332_c0_g1~~TRINITY_DN13332_c0_g1_i4.p1  ORF type:complete len:478 (+),score=41.60 TRINITY_DN13332_c0_g1_i4:78-1436(+)
MASGVGSWLTPGGLHRTVLPPAVRPEVAVVAAAAADGIGDTPGRGALAAYAVCPLCRSPVQRGRRPPDRPAAAARCSPLAPSAPLQVENGGATGFVAVCSADEAEEAAAHARELAESLLWHSRRLESGYCSEGAAAAHAVRLQRICSSSAPGAAGAADQPAAADPQPVAQDPPGDSHRSALCSAAPPPRGIPCSRVVYCFGEAAAGSVRLQGPADCSPAPHSRCHSPPPPPRSLTPVPRPRSPESPGVWASWPPEESLRTAEASPSASPAAPSPGGILSKNAGSPPPPLRGKHASPPPSPPSPPQCRSSPVSAARRSPRGPRAPGGLTQQRHKAPASPQGQHSPPPRPCQHSNHRRRHRSGGRLRSRSGSRHRSPPPGAPPMGTYKSSPPGAAIGARSAPVPAAAVPRVSFAAGTQSAAGAPRRAPSASPGRPLPGVSVWQRTAADRGVRAR